VIWYRNDQSVDSDYVATVDGSTSFSYNDYTFKVHHNDKNIKYRCEAVNKFTDPPVYSENSIGTIYGTNNFLSTACVVYVYYINHEWFHTTYI